MSRPQNKMVAGYFPTPVEHTPAILSLIAPATPRHKILDPCAGAGTFIAAAESAWNVTAYANELDHDRAALCVAKLGSRALQGDLERLSTSNNAYSLLYMNPPYDDDGAADRDSKRREFVYLRLAWRWLQDNGLGLWVVYRQHVTPQAIAFFAANASRADLWALPGKHLGAYDQVVVVASKGRAADPAQLKADLTEMQANPLPLTVQDEPAYHLPAPPTHTHFYFAPDVVDAETGLRYIQSDGAWKQGLFQTLMTCKPRSAETITSVTPPRPGHTLVVLAAGLADGAVIQSPEYGPIAIRGKTIPVETIARVEELEGKDPDHPTIRTIKRLKPTSQLTLLAKDGTVVELNNDESMINFVVQHQQPLTHYINQRFKPLYQFDLNGLSPFLKAIRLNHKYPLFTPQMHVTAAVTRGFEERDGILLVGQMGVGKVRRTTA